MSPRSAALSLATSMMLVGLYVGGAQQLLAWFPLAVLAALRFAIAALAMAGWLRRPPGAPRLDGTEHRLLLVQAALGNVLFTVLMLEGVARGGALLAGVVMAALPAAVALLAWALLAWALLGERPSRRTGLAVACGVAGIALLGLGRHAGTGADAPPLPADPWGLPLLLGALVCEATQAVLGKRLGRRHAPRFLTAAINLWCLALSLPFALWAAPAWSPAAVPALAWLGLLAYALMASVLAVWLWMRGLSVLPASTAGVFTVLLPLSTGAVGLLLGGETAGPLHGLAYALALGGLLMVVGPSAWAGLRSRLGPTGPEAGAARSPGRRPADPP